MQTCHCLRGPCVSACQLPASLEVEVYCWMQMVGGSSRCVCGSAAAALADVSQSGSHVIQSRDDMIMQKDQSLRVALFKAWSISDLPEAKQFLGCDFKIVMPQHRLLRLGFMSELSCAFSCLLYLSHLL